MENNNRLWRIHLRPFYQRCQTSPEKNNNKTKQKIKRAQIGCDVLFEGNILLWDQTKKQNNNNKTFLANPNYKQCFINKLSNVLKENLFETLHAADDADCLIVGTTLKLVKGTATALVGEDTDLLVLLLFHRQPEYCKVLFSTGTKSAAKV